MADNGDHIVIIIKIIHRYQINKNGDTQNYTYLYVQGLITRRSSLNLNSPLLVYLLIQFILKRRLSTEKYHPTIVSPLSYRTGNLSDYFLRDVLKSS